VAFREDLTRAPQAINARRVGDGWLLCTGLAFSGRHDRMAERGIYGDEIVHAQSTPFPAPGADALAGRPAAGTSTATCSSLRATSTATTRRWCTRGCRRCPVRGACLCSGGGDGLAVREILKTLSVQHRHAGRPRSRDDGDCFRHRPSWSR
jgi:spermidine synthase